MLHHIDTKELGPHGADMARAVSTCVHCGFCLPACPTYRVLGEEMDSPRGRILLMKNVLEGAMAMDEAQPHIDRCLGCLACVTACPSGVAYGDLLTPFRMHAESTRRRSAIDWLRRQIVMRTLPYPGRFRLAAQSGRLARRMRGLVPGPFRAMLDLLPPDLPAARPLPALHPATGKRRARVALLAGCAQQVLAPNIGWAALRVLGACGVEVVVPPDQACCGALAMHVGEEATARQLARTNLRAFPDDVDAIVTTAAGCGSGMREYGLLFRGAPEEAAATRLAGRVIDVCELLETQGLLADSLPPLKPLSSQSPSSKSLKSVSARHEETRHDESRADASGDRVKVAYHDACHLVHGQGVRRSPRALLRRIPNLTLVEINDGGYCCGSAGTYNLDQPEIANHLGERKADAIRDTGARVVVSGNIGCLTQIRAHLAVDPTNGTSQPSRVADTGFEVLHTVELLDRALQGTL